MNLNYLDYTTTTFANSFAGRSPLIDGFMVQVCFTYILSAVPLTALLVFLWDKNASDERRIRLLAGAAAIGLSGLACKILQITLPMLGLGRTRPLYDPNLIGIIHWPNGLLPHTFEGHSSWPSDSAAWLFGLALLIWLHGGKRLGIPALFLAALSSSIRIPMGIHFLSDILCGAAIGTLMVLASQRLPIPRVAFKLPKLQRKWPVAFCLAMFVVTYSLATFGADLRNLANAIPHRSSHLGTGELSRRSEKQAEELGYPVTRPLTMSHANPESNLPNRF
jgi:membrane-associated phospholipid phosphatase